VPVQGAASPDERTNILMTGFGQVVPSIAVKVQCVRVPLLQQPCCMVFLPKINWLSRYSVLGPWWFHMGAAEPDVMYSFLPAQGGIAATAGTVALCVLCSRSVSAATACLTAATNLGFQACNVYARSAYKACCNTVAVAVQI
jgi:hypothetical protein